MSVVTSGAVPFHLPRFLTFFILEEVRIRIKKGINSGYPLVFPFKMRIINTITTLLPIR